MSKILQIGLNEVLSKLKKIADRRNEKSWVFLECFANIMSPLSAYLTKL